MCFLLPTVARVAACPHCVSQFVPQFVPHRVPLSLFVCLPIFVSFGRVLGIGTLSPSGFPVVSHNFQFFPVVLKVSSNGLPDVFHLSPSCLRVVGQILPIVFRLSPSCVPVVSKMSRGCAFPDVVSQLPPKFLRLLASLPLASNVFPFVV